jgi:integrase
VTVYERPGGRLYARSWDPVKEAYQRRSLGHSNKARAKEYALEQAEALTKGQDEILTGTPTVGRLIRLYLTHQTPRKSAQVQKADQRKADLWKGFLGADRDVKRITKRDWLAFTDARRAGRLCPHGAESAHELSDESECSGPSGRPVGPRTVQTDCQWLRAALSWAVDWETDEGRRLLAANPVRGYPMPTEKNPKRPTATEAQLRAILAVADQVTMEVVPAHPLHPKYGIETKEPKKLAQVPGYLRELLLLVNGTGRRIGSVRTLTYADLRLDEKPWGAIRWAADRDKIGRETTTPIGPDVRAVLDAILESRPGAGTLPLFPAPEDPTKPIDKYLADKLKSRGVALARRKAAEAGRKLELPPRWGYHSFRRKFATELKHAPGKDVADLGGWKDLNTLRQVYQMSDKDTMVQALASRLELREAR